MTMKTVMVEKRIGELLGPVDWSYDFTRHDWGDGKGGVNPECSQYGTEQLKKLVSLMESGARCSVSCYESEHVVLAVGMYDGWPFWEPTPSVMLSTFFGPEWHPWYSIRNVRVVEGERR
jgi:hypothetical protein